MLNYPISEKICTRLIMLVQLDSSEISSPHNNGILSRYTTVESNLTSVTCLFCSDSDQCIHVGQNLETNPAIQTLKTKTLLTETQPEPLTPLVNDEGPMMHSCHGWSLIV